MFANGPMVHVDSTNARVSSVYIYRITSASHGKPKATPRNYGTQNNALKPSNHIHLTAMLIPNKIMYSLITWLPRDFPQQHLARVLARSGHMISLEHFIRLDLSVSLLNKYFLITSGCTSFH